MHGNVLQEHHAQYDVPKLRELGFSQIWRVSGNYIALRSAAQVNLKLKVLKCAATPQPERPGACTGCLHPFRSSRTHAHAKPTAQTAERTREI